MRRARTCLRALWLLAIVVAAGSATSPAHAAPYGIFNRSSDEWKVVETKYFRFYFTQETPLAAARLLEIADDTFERLNAFYGYQPPGKIGITIVGYTAYSNGFADYSHNRITIFTTPIDFHSRSRVPWLEGVFTHELAHVLSLNTASSWFARVPLVLGTGLARSDQAQAIARLPVYGGNWPHWFTEGVAQFDTFQLGRDGYDENRSALQRAWWEDRMMFPLPKLAFFGGEQWYNTGFSFLLFLEQKYGQGTVHRLFHAAGEHYDAVFENLFSRTLGRSLSDLEAEFRQQVQARYEAHLISASAGLYDGKPVQIEGQDQAYDELTPSQRDYLRDGYRAMPLRFLNGKLFYLQGDGISYGDFSIEKGSIAKVESLAEGSAIAANGKDSYFVLEPDGNSTSLLPYVYRPQFESPTLALVDTDGNTRVLQRESRLLDLDACTARAELAGIYNDGDGSARLALYKLDHAGSKDVQLHSTTPRFPLPVRAFDEVRTPRYSPDCKTLYFSRRIGRDHDLFALDLQSGRIDTISAESAFELYPEPTADGVYYVSSRGGVMNVYFRAKDGSPPRAITQAITAHHHPVHTPGGLVFARLHGTGFQLHYQADNWKPDAMPVVADVAKAVQQPDTAAPPATAALASADDYRPFSRDLLSPTIVPLLDVEYDVGRASTPLTAQAGLELYAEDQLSQHGLLLRGYAGNRNSFVFDYRNQMTPLTLRARTGMTDARGLYVYDPAGPDSYEHVTDYRWGFLAGSASIPLSLFHSLTASAETTRDIGSTTGARSRRFDFVDPRYARELYGLRYDYSGLDRSDPTFRERDINKRGYRQLGLGAYYGVEHVHPSLPQYDPTLRAGASGYFRAEFNYSEYLALPALMHGYFDHSLQLDLGLGYISRDIAFLPFLGGGQLYSLGSPEANTSVGFVGYPFYSVRGETLVNLGLSYRAPIARRLGWNLGIMYIDDLYFQLFTSWGNIWSFDSDGKRQVPFVDRAANGRRVLGDVGIDIRIGNFFQEIETNVGTTLRAVYRVVPFSRCPDTDPNGDPQCLDVAGERGFLFYAIVGGGF